jgi:hypothetical protein
LQDRGRYGARTRENQSRLRSVAATVRPTSETASRTAGSQRSFQEIPHHPVIPGARPRRHRRLHLNLIFTDVPIDQLSHGVAAEVAACSRPVHDDHRRCGFVVSDRQFAPVEQRNAHRRQESITHRSNTDSLGAHLIQRSARRHERPNVQLLADENPVSCEARELHVGVARKRASSVPMVSAFQSWRAGDWSATHARPAGFQIPRW